MPNQLIHESSPYLLQHKDNPVDWHAWGSKAIEKARREDKPIFLSIGYSACHWCHVMEHESFENDEIAALLNENFVSIKVDREERPDLDQIYMNVVQMLTGHGGWPMSVFLTPELKPFYGGTYWPPQSARGMPGFDHVLHAVIDAWQNRRPQATETAEQITAELNKLGLADGETVPQPSADWIAAAVAQLRGAFDSRYGGFGQSPKFPHPMDLALLLRVWHRDRQANAVEMVRHTLDRMAAGGIYDQLGGGFARYSVDARWLVPHFEKMLYDNALLAGVYLDAYLATGEATYGRVVCETLDYILRDMTDPAGGFYSTEDADSEGEEGLFYTWTPEEIAAVLGPERAETFCRVFDVNDVGNFEGRCILNLPKTIDQSAAILGREPDDLAKELAASKQQLFAAREKRVRPGRDDKIIVAWNGLMIDAMARAGAGLGEPKYVAAASRAADFILTQMVDPDGRLLHTWRHGKAKLAAYLDDYTCLANSLVSLYEATFEERWIDEAVRLIETVREKFADPAGGFFYTASDHEQLIARNKEWTDSSTPSGNGMAANVLVRLGRLLGRREFVEAALTTIGHAHNLVRQAPTAVGQLLLALEQTIDPSYELVLVGNFDQNATQQAIEAIHRRFLPNCVVAARDSKKESRSVHLDAIFQGKESTGGHLALFICREFACEEPAVGLEAIKSRLDALAPS